MATAVTVAATVLPFYGLYKLFESIFDDDPKPPTRGGAATFEARSEQTSSVASAMRATSFGRLAVDTITGSIDLVHGAAAGYLPGGSLLNQRPVFGNTGLFGIGMILGSSFGLAQDLIVTITGAGEFVGTGALTLGTGGVAAPTMVLPVAQIAAGVAMSRGHAENFKNGINFAKAEGPRSASPRGETAATQPYKRPSGATTAEQRASVQGRPCVDCGAVTPKQVADHKTALVKERYETGSIDVRRMRSVDSVQPQCPACSARQGGQLSWYSRFMRSLLGE